MYDYKIANEAQLHIENPMVALQVGSWKKAVKPFQICWIYKSEFHRLHKNEAQ